MCVVVFKLVIWYVYALGESEQFVKLELFKLE